MRKTLQIINEKGEELEKLEFDGGYNIIYNNKTNPDNLYKIRKLDNGKFGDRHWIKNYYYRPIAEKLIEKFPEIRHINPRRILFLEDTDWKEKENTGRTWMGRVKTASKEFSNMMGYDYIIEFRAFYTDRMQIEQIIALVYHELRHIGTDGKLQKHDVEDWENMVATLGVDWATTMGEIPDLIDELEDWEELGSAAKQLNMFRLRKINSIARRQKTVRCKKITT